MEWNHACGTARLQHRRGVQVNGQYSDIYNNATLMKTRNASSSLSFRKPLQTIKASKGLKRALSCIAHPAFKRTDLNCAQEDPTQ